MSDNVLITGGAGLVGSQIAKRLLEDGKNVFVLDDLSAYPFDYRSEFGPAGDLTFIEGSVAEIDCLTSLPASIDAVVHAAAYADVAACNRNYETDFLVNVKGTHNVLAESLRRGVQRFVFVSSASVYGDSRASTLSELHACAPISTYGNSKLWGERQTLLFRSLHGLPATALRYFSVYGSPQIPKEGSHSWCVAIFAMRLLIGQPVVIYGSGRQVRDFIHVSDVANGTVRALESPDSVGHAINIGTGIPTSILDRKFELRELRGLDGNGETLETYDLSFWDRMDRV
jgi:nucleoside-diphosphate-sugar epimerase